MAALLEHPEAFEPPVVAVLSGGNIDPLLLAKVLRHGLSAAGRYLMFRCRIADRPGALATLLGELAGLGANVLDVVHERVAPRLRVDEVEVLLQVETRGPGHCDEVISSAPAGGLHAPVRLRSPNGRRAPVSLVFLTTTVRTALSCRHCRRRIPQQPRLVDQREQAAHRGHHRHQGVHGGAPAGGLARDR